MLASENPLHQAAYPAYENVISLIQIAVKQFPNRIALILEEDGQQLQFSYQELMREIKRLSNDLRDLGIQPHMRVVLLSENRPELVIYYLALLSMDATAVILDSNLASTDYENLIRKTDPSLVFVSHKLQSKIPAHLDWPVLNLDLNIQKKIIINPQFAPTEKDVCTILYTSGTTGDFKGVLLTHQNLLFAIESAQLVTPANFYHKTVCILPLFHVFGLVCALLTPLATGAKVIFVERLEGPLILKAMQKHGCTVLNAVPRVLELFAANIKLKVAQKSLLIRSLFKIFYETSRIFALFGKDQIGKKLFKSLHKNFGGELQLIVSGGASLDKKVFNDLKILGFQIIEGYGLTETASLVTVNPVKQSRAGTVGVTIPNVEVVIYNPNAMGEGEVIIRGPNVMKGYFRNEEATKEAIRDGWLHSGDLGKFDHKKYLVITGRIKEIIVKTNGEKAMPEDIERRYHNIPGIADLAIVGMPAKNGFGEEIHAAIVPETQINSLETREELKKLIVERSKHIPSNLRIQECHFVAEIPKTSTLKVKRKVLAAQLITQLEKNTVGYEEKKKLAETELEKTINKIVTNFLQLIFSTAPAHLKPGMSLQFDLGLDSLHRIELINLIQKHFLLVFDEQQLATINTLEDLAHAVEMAKAKKSLQPMDKKTDFNLLHQTTHLADATNQINHQLPKNYALQNFMFLLGKKFLRLYFQLEAKGKENLSLTTPFIICANHTSHLDGASIAATCDFPLQQLAFMAAKDYHFDQGLKSKLINAVLNLVPFERNIEMLGMLHGLQHCQQHVLRGNKLIIFPEGTRSLDGNLQKFKSAIAMIAYELNLNIVPAFISGAFQCLPKGKRLPKKGKIEVRYGKPLVMQHYRNLAKEDYEIYKMILQDLRQAIELLAVNRNEVLLLSQQTVVIPKENNVSQ